MASSEQWGTFLRQCLDHRIDAAEFKTLSRLLFQRCPIAEDVLLDVLLETWLATGIKWDPLLPLYIDCLRRMGRLQIPTVLHSLLKHSSIHEKLRKKEASSPGGMEKKKKSNGLQQCYTFMTDGRVMQDVMLSMSAGNIPATMAEAIGIFSATVDWIQAVVAWHNSHMDAGQQTGGLMSSPDAASVFETLGIILTALSGNVKGLEVLSGDSHAALKIKLGQALSAYLPLCAEVSLGLRDRLASLQKAFNLYGEANSKALDMSMMDSVNVNALQFEASVMDGPVVNSRAGLYIYINAMLVARPLVDDNVLLSYLANRYAGHYDALIEEIITASFDVLSNAMYRNESHRTMFVFRSWLVNKLPSFFAAMSATSLVPSNMSPYINNALSRLNPKIYPSFSQMFSMQGNAVLSDVRQEFVFACASHRLVPEHDIERLLGEPPMQAPRVGYIKDDLVSQINSHHERAEQLIGEIESTEGNAGAIVGAITEVMHNLCSQKETMTLKNICNSLSRRPQALDVILLFRSPKQMLQPLCELLDSWHWDEDQGESQPVYDEFGSILLLVLTFKYRYNLHPHDLGIVGSDSFVLRLLERGACSQKLEDLSDKQNKNLGAWIGALFIAEGISEETMSACSPQEFYLLVSTLFDQSLTACEAGKVEFDTLKGGFEYLLEPFLLPSLVVALTWLGNHIWETESEPTIAIKTLQSLVNPSSISGEAREIHRTVLSITARSLESQLKDVRARHPSRADIKPILDALEPCLSFQRTGTSHRSELETWTTHPGGGLLDSIRSTFQSLVFWGSSPDVTMEPPSYTHRQLLSGIRILGAPRVLHALLDEIKLQTETGNGDIALEIGAVIVCAPLPESFAVEQNSFHPVDTTKEPAPRCPILTLRDALFLSHDSVPKLSEKEPLRAEVLVRLFRRVNTLMAPSQTPNLDVTNIIHNMSLPVGDHARMDLDLPGAGVDDPDAGDNEDSDHLNRMLDNAAAAAAAGLDSGVGQGMGAQLDTSIDDMLNAAVGEADMTVGNPEFYDLDSMEGMF